MNYDEALKYARNKLGDVPCVYCSERVIKGCRSTCKRYKDYSIALSEIITNKTIDTPLIIKLINKIFRKK